MAGKTEQQARPYQFCLNRIEGVLAEFNANPDLTEEEQYAKAEALMASANRILIIIRDAQVARARLAGTATGDFTSPKDPEHKV